tara:strand:- start:39 stop:506 length:468 start_codon:yes stop_codon:yes gene_type:complete
VLPNSPLKKALRPVLKNLAEFKQLSISHLNALGRVLELLSRYFKDSLGEQLLIHLKKWTTPSIIISTKKWKSGQEPKIAAKIIELFQLLPDCTSLVTNTASSSSSSSSQHSTSTTKSSEPSRTTFLNELINTIIQLELVIHEYRERKNTDGIGCR